MSVTAPQGFRASAAHAGLRTKRPHDLALVAADAPASAAGVFTAHAAAAAPVRLSRKHLASSGGRARVVLLNAGCANAGTGPRGDATAFTTAEAAAAALGCAVDEVLVGSTGPIGPQLRAEAVVGALPAAVDALAAGGGAGDAAAHAILTTDTVAKQAVARREGWTVGGMAKGAGMIRPDMATMLAVLTTDAAAEPADLDRALRQAVDRSFHALNVDGCASTNDTVVAMAGGGRRLAPAPAELADALGEVCRSLARQIAADAEGASKVVHLQVVGAADDATARRAGRAIADSALVRASFYGADPNWGRMLGAVAAAGIDFEPDGFGVAYEGVAVARRGLEEPYDRPALHAAIAAAGDISVEVTLGAGPGKAEVVTVDLTPAYVEFNAEYS